MLIWIGIEIFLKKGKSYFLIVNHLLNFQQLNAKLKEKIIKLKKREISTLYYLLKLNYFSLSTFNNAIQYSIFP